LKATVVWLCFLFSVEPHAAATAYNLAPKVRWLESV
jgi:hypothetical protein